MMKQIYPAARRQQGAAPIQIVQPVMAGVKISDAHKAGVVETQDTGLSYQQEHNETPQKQYQKNH